jgi:hypothetical protein
MLAIHHRRFLRGLSSLTLAVFTISVAFAQNHPQKTATSIESVDGTVEGVFGNSVYVHTEVRLLALSVDDHTEMWKGKVLHDLSPVQAGDHIFATYRIDTSGKQVAEGMWLNIVNLFGVITRVGDDQFEVLTNPNADPESAYKKENKILSVDANTIFESSAKQDLEPGREVQIVGLDLRSGRILATRLAVYARNVR